MDVIYPNCLILPEKVRRIYKKKASFSYTRLLLELSVRPDLIHKLVPAHYKENLLQSGIDIDNFIPIPLKDLRLNIVD
jgi:hypothetical protein